MLLRLFKDILRTSQPKLKRQSTLTVDVLHLQKSRGSSPQHPNMNCRRRRRRPSQSLYCKLARNVETAFIRQHIQRPTCSLSSELLHAHITCTHSWWWPSNWRQCLVLPLQFTITFLPAQLSRLRMHWCKLEFTGFPLLVYYHFLKILFPTESLFLHLLLLTLFLFHVSVVDEPVLIGGLMPRTWYGRWMTKNQRVRTWREKLLFVL